MLIPLEAKNELLLILWSLHTEYSLRWETFFELIRCSSKTEKKYSKNHMLPTNAITEQRTRILLQEVMHLKII